MKIGLVGRSGITALLVFAFLSLSMQLRAQFTPAPAGSAFSIPDGPTATYDKQRQAPDLASWLAYALRRGAYPRIGIRRAGITASRNRAATESGERTPAKKAHCALLRLLSLESLSEPWTGVREIARDGFYQCEGPLSGQ